jgi:hypothetical protein
MNRTYVYPVDVEWRSAGERRSRARVSALRMESVDRRLPRLTTAPVYAVPHKRPIF